MRGEALFKIVLTVASSACMMGCVLAGARAPVPEYDPQLLLGVDVFGEEVRASETPAHDVLGLTPEMRQFALEAAEAQLEVVRYRRLVDKLEKHGYFDEAYQAGVTTTAAHTFKDKVGNCISYTNMFVALARAANIEANYQLVERRFPTWTVDGGVLVRNNHVNVFIRAPRVDFAGEPGYTVDFNLVDPDPDANARIISDEYAASLFYANLSFNELVNGNDRTSFSYLRRALELAPENPDLWINLGSFYSRRGYHERALEAFDVAASISPREKAVLSGRERALRALGETKAADELERKVRRYRNSNPFYHFAIAQIAFEQGDFTGSLQAVNRAIKKRKRNPRFHFLKGLTLFKLGDREGAAENFKKAERFGRYDDLWLRYTREASAPDLTG